MNKISTRNMVLCAFFAALTAVFSQIQIPMVPVPMNLATLSVFIAGGLLGWKYGGISQLVYVLLGVIGAPVFHGFTGGFGIVMGKTGGYIIGYIAAAVITGLFVEKSGQNLRFLLPIGMVVGLLACYALGTAWFLVLTHATLKRALMLCVVPFLFADAIKIAVATVLVIKLKKALKQ